MDCVFCKIAKGEIPAKVVYEDEEVISFYDINPKAPVHVLVIPKRHFTNLMEEIPPPVASAILRGIRETVKKLGVRDYRVISNNGRGAGQEVFHLHFHVIAGITISPATV